MKKPTGYLKEPLKIFYVIDKKEWECPYHYHGFDKITLFLQGHVTYEIEGKSYALQPYDIVVVRAGQMHRPIIHDDMVYERIIAYISSEYLQQYEHKGCHLTSIFSTSSSSVLRQPPETGSLYGVSSRLRQVCTTKDKTPRHHVLLETLFLEFLIYLAEALETHHIGYVKTGKQNEKMLLILQYIHSHLTENLSIPFIASQFYMSPDYLMHVFKEETGQTLGTYITTKRLLLARELMKQQLPLTTICYDSGFKQYSTFYRAWKKQYGQSPKKEIPHMTKAHILE